MLVGFHTEVERAGCCVTMVSGMRMEYIGIGEAT